MRQFGGVRRGVVRERLFVRERVVMHARGLERLALESSGTYTLQSTNEFGCDSVAEVQFELTDSLVHFHCVA